MREIRDRLRDRWRWPKSESSPSYAVVVLALLVGFAGGAISVTTLRAGQPAVTETPLLRTDLAGVERKELIVSRFDTAPGWAHGWHYHPGHELVYVLDGSAVVQVEGKPPMSVPAGTAAYFAPKQVHEGKNASATAPLKFLLVRIHEKGQPLSVELR